MALITLTNKPPKRPVSPPHTAEIRRVKKTRKRLLMFGRRGMQVEHNRTVIFVTQEEPGDLVA